MTKGETKRLRIGELAAAFDLNPKTIRYYEDIGLLPPPQRSEAGYRLYDDSDRERLEFIRKAKTLGLTLEEIGQILFVRDQGEPPCDHVLALLDTKITVVDQHIQALVEFREELATLRREAMHAVQADGAICRIIEHHQPAQPRESILTAARALRSSGER